MLIAATAKEIAFYSLSGFLILVGLGLAYALVRLGGTLKRLTSLIVGVEQEVVPVIAKAGGSIDRVNGQLDKLDVVTGSAVDAVASVDSAVRAVTLAAKMPVQKAAAWTAGLKHGVASYRRERSFEAAKVAARAAAEERGREFSEELRSEPSSEE
jgi:uncharacterized protein YoxC